jgi:hypothetical protein
MTRPKFPCNEVLARRSRGVHITLTRDREPTRRYTLSPGSHQRYRPPLKQQLSEILPFDEEE